MAPEGGAEARSDDKNVGAVESKDAAARANHDGADYEPCSHPWDDTFGPCPEST